MLKRLAALILALLLAGALAGCGILPNPATELAASASSSAAEAVSAQEESGVVSSQSTAPAASGDAGQALAPLPVTPQGQSPLTGLPAPEGMADGQRPVAVMVANDDRGMPQRGLAAADVVVEMLTEGGVTRLMALYTDYRALPQVGPVRSTRDQFLQIAIPQNAIMASIGGSIYADNLVSVLNYRGVDGIRLGSTSFWFDEARSLPKPGGKLNEYCFFTDAGLLWAGMEATDVQPTGEVRDMFRFAAKAAKEGTEAGVINCVYSGTANSGFKLSEKDGLYKKYIFGNKHKDEDGSRLSYTNVVMLYCDIGLKPDGLLTEFDFDKGGTGVYFNAGNATPITWQKHGVQAQLHLFDEQGSELEIQPGKTFVGFLPTGTENALTWSAREAEEG